MGQGDLALVVADLRAMIAGLESTLVELNETVGRLDESLATRNARIAELEKPLAESRRAGKRQSAPFSKGAPKDEPARPGRKSGDDHGRHGHRVAPVAPDRELAAPLPGCCPECGRDVLHERDAEQLQVELPEARPVVTRFVVGAGRCRRCGRRVQGRHPEQASDALGAAASQVGPRAKAWAAWLHYELGLSSGKCAVSLSGSCRSCYM